MGEPRDAPRIAEIHVESWRAAYSSILSSEVMATMSVSDREEMWKRRLSLPDDDPGRVLVIDVDEEVVGFSLTLSGRDDDLDPTAIAELAGLYLIPSH